MKFHDPRQSNTASAFSSFTELLRRRALWQPDRRAYTFLVDGEEQELHLTYGELDRQARTVGARLQSQIHPGERALLLYPPGLEFHSGFMGCLYAGVIAVPAYPPDPTRWNSNLPRLQAIAKDAGAKVVLTTSRILSMAEHLFSEVPDFAALQWISTNDLPNDLADQWREPEVDRNTLAFLQYTSGATGTPKGVMLSHGNLLDNQEVIANAFEHTANSVLVTWLPIYHDMGICGGLLQPLYKGFPSIILSPLDFLQRPFRWLQAISRYKGTTSGGPNFAYDLCVRKMTSEEKALLDLSHWDLAFNGSEPVRKDTFDRFVQAFETCGFRREAFYPCYGLAEATLIVSGGRKSDPLVTTAVGKDKQTFVGCGHVMPGHTIRIAHSETMTLCDSNQIGEIWVSGPSVAQGYWNRPKETQEAFHAYLNDRGEGPFLRTGDLGFLKEGELFVTGRIKDLLIIGGQNHYPQDIEWTVEQSHPSIRPGCCAAFSVDIDGEERVVIVAEVDGQHPSLDMEAMIGDIKQTVALQHGLTVYKIVFLKPKTIPKTSSGKIQRHACKTLFFRGSFGPIEGSKTAGKESTMASKPSQNEIQTWLVAKLAELLHVESESIDRRTSFFRYGLNSIAAMSLSGELETWLGIRVSPTIALKHPTIESLADFLTTQVQESVSPKVGERPDKSSDLDKDLYPLSSNQRAFWRFHQHPANAAALNVVHALRIRSEIDLPALRRVLQKLTDRHPALRTTFGEVNGEPVQRIHASMEICFQTEEATSWTETRIHDRLAQEVDRPFDLEKGPLARVTLLTKTAKEHILILAIHHIVCDAWSIAVLFMEMGALYPAEAAGSSLVLPPPPLRYTDLVQWEREILTNDEGARHWRYWQERFSGNSHLLDLPTDRPRPQFSNHRGRFLAHSLEPELTRSLKTIAEAQDATLFTALLAALKMLLHAYTGREDIFIGAITAGRNKMELAGVIGLMINWVGIRSDFSGDPSFTEILGRVRKNVLEAFEHQDYPFAEIAERLKLHQNPTEVPGVRLMFNFLKSSLVGDDFASFALAEKDRHVDLGGLHVENLPLPRDTLNFDLHLMAAEIEGGVRMKWYYREDLFEEGTIRRMTRDFQNLLAQIISDPKRRLSEIRRFRA
jgi:acyl-CoA synthetase (AMP-forming)/AMP-acid ligase II/acyl carrier protein